MPEVLGLATKDTAHRDGRECYAEVERSRSKK